MLFCWQLKAALQTSKGQIGAIIQLYVLLSASAPAGLGGGEGDLHLVEMRRVKVRAPPPPSPPTLGAPPPLVFFSLLLFVYFSLIRSIISEPYFECDRRVISWNFSDLWRYCGGD